MHTMPATLTEQELVAAHCWEADDRVPRRPEITEFRRRLRYHQSQWREANGHPIGSQPIAPKPNGGPLRAVGGRPPPACPPQTRRALIPRRAPHATQSPTVTDQ